MSKLKAIAVMLVLVSVVAAIAVLSSHKKAEESTAQDETEKCLHDPDCRSRLEAAVNEVYSESGYDGVYTAP